MTLVADTIRWLHAGQIERDTALPPRTVGANSPQPSLRCASRETSPGRGAGGDWLDQQFGSSSTPRPDHVWIDEDEVDANDSSSEPSSVRGDMWSPPPPSDLAMDEDEELEFNAEVDAHIAQFLAEQEQMDHQPRTDDRADKPPARPERRYLDEDEQFLAQLYVTATSQHWTELQYSSIQALFALKQFKIMSFDRLKRWAEQLSGLRVEKVPMCSAGCIVYVGAASDLLVCPHCHRDRNKRNGKPHRHILYFSIEPMLDAILQDTESTAYLRDAHAAAREARKAHERGQSVEIVSPWQGGMMRHMQQVRKHSPNASCLSRFPVMISISSDGAELYSRRDAHKAVDGAFYIGSFLHLPADKAYQIRMQWRFGCQGPEKSASVNSLVARIELEMEQLEPSRERWVMVDDGDQTLERTNMAVLFYRADTVELYRQFRLAGSAAKLSCPWCLMEGVQRENGGYAPPALATHNSTRGDLRLEGVNDDVEGCPFHQPSRRDFQHHVKTGEAIQKLRARAERGDLAVASQLITNTGVVGVPLLSKLKSTSLAYPITMAQDHMHLYNRNVWPMFLRLLFNFKGPAYNLSPTRSQVPSVHFDTLEHYQKMSRGLRPTEISETARNFFTKFGDLKCWEVQSFMTQDVYYLLRGTAPEPACRLARQASIIAQLAAMRTVSDVAMEESALNLVDVPLDGRLVVHWRLIRRLIDRFTYNYEKAYYGRDPKRMIEVISASLHRLSHTAAFLADLGPADAYSQNTLETLIGVDKSATNTRSHTVAGIVNVMKSANIRALLHVKYDVAPLNIPTKAMPKQSHPSAACVLLHTRAARSTDHFDREWTSAWQAWAADAGWLADALSTVDEWGRLEISNGQTVRSRWWEKVASLPTTLGEHKAQQASATNHAKEMANRTARFVIVSRDHPCVKSMVADVVLTMFHDYSSQNGARPARPSLRWTLSLSSRRARKRCTWQPSRSSGRSDQKPLWGCMCAATGGGRSV